MSPWLLFISFLCAVAALSLDRERKAAKVEYVLPAVTKLFPSSASLFFQFYEKKEGAQSSFKAIFFSRVGKYSEGLRLKEVESLIFPSHKCFQKSASILQKSTLEYILAIKLHLPPFLFPFFFLSSISWGSYSDRKAIQ